MKTSRLIPLCLPLLALVCLPAPAAAQEPSPVATPAMDGVTIEPLGVLVVGPGQVVPVARVTLAPGAALPPHASPGAAVAHVESGQVSFVAITGVARRATLTVLPAPGTPAAGTPGIGTPVMEATPTMQGTPTMAGTPTAGVPTDVFAVVEEEVVVVGEEIPLGPGEGIAFGTDEVHTFRNTGTEPAVLLIVGEIPPDQPFRFVGEEAGATPVATPAP